MVFIRIISQRQLPPPPEKTKQNTNNSSSEPLLSVSPIYLVDGLVDGWMTTYDKMNREEF
jgi:hypothetical protein